MRNRIRKAFPAMLAGICAMLITGCGAAKLPETVVDSSLVVDQKGKVTSYLVDSFDKAYYNVEDLEAMAMEDAAVYNSTHPSDTTPLVTVEQVQLLEEGNKVQVVQTFADPETYADYNETVFYYGTAAGTQEMDTALKSVKDGSAIDPAELEKGMENRHFLITEAKAMIYCPYPVAYISEGAVYREDGSVDTTLVEGPVTIMMKK